MQTQSTFVQQDTIASPPRAFACDDLARACCRQPQPTTNTHEHDGAHQLLQSMQARAHPANDRNPAPRGTPALRPVTRFGVVRRQRTDLSGRESAPCKARPPATNPKRAPLSREPASPHLERGKRDPALAEARLEPAARTDEPWYEPGCLPLREIRPFLFDPDWPQYGRLTPASCAPLVARNESRSLTDRALRIRRQPAGSAR